MFRCGFGLGDMAALLGMPSEQVARPSGDLLPWVIDGLTPAASCRPGGTDLATAGWPAAMFGRGLSPRFLASRPAWGRLCFQGRWHGRRVGAPFAPRARVKPGTVGPAASMASRLWQAVTPEPHWSHDLWASPP